MKKTYEFKVEAEKFILVNTNPNDKWEPFTIDKKEIQFDTNKFYQYVFSDVTTEMEIEIVDKSDSDDKLAKRLYETISEISSGVMKKIEWKMFYEFWAIINI